MGNAITRLAIFLLSVQVATSQSIRWESVASLRSLVRCLAVDSLDNLYAGTESEGLSVSRDHGVTWENLGAQFGKLHITALAVGPGNRVYVATQIGQVSVTTDGGATWQLTGTFVDPVSIAVSPMGTILVGEWGAPWGIVGLLFRSTDSGNTWRYIHLAPPNDPTVWALLAVDGYVYAGTNAGLFLSSDGGEHWDSLNTGLTDRSLQALALDRNRTLYAGTLQTGVFILKEGDTSWTQSTLGNKSLNAIAIDSSGSVIAATWESGVFRSTDHGLTWVNTFETIQNKNTVSLAVDRSGNIFVGCDSGAILKGSVVTGMANDHPLPDAPYRLEQNYPNPFNPVTVISYQLPVVSDVKLAVYDMLGREVATLVNGVEEPGFKSVQWAASGVASGVYFYRLSVSPVARRDLLPATTDPAGQAGVPHEGDGQVHQINGGQAGTFVETKKLMVLR